MREGRGGTCLKLEWAGWIELRIDLNFCSATAGPALQACSLQLAAGTATPFFLVSRSALLPRSLGPIFVFGIGQPTSVGTIDITELLQFE